MSEQQNNQGKGRILVVDDDGIVAMVIQLMLENEGYEVVGVVEDGQAAVDAALALQPDVVLMDLKMPEMDGIEATRRIMQQCPIPIIALTAYSTSVWESNSFEAGMVDFLEKPASAQALSQAIALARHRTRST